MKFEFAEGNYVDEFKFGGALTITAQGAKEVDSLIKHFRLYSDMSNVSVLQARIEALQKETLSHVIQSDKRPVYEVSGALGDEFTAPYGKWALDNFGFDGVFPDLEIPRKWDGLFHTNYQARLYTQSGHICFDAFTSAQPWNGKSAQDYAQWLVSDYIAEEFGTRRHEPEFISTGYGDQMKRNPNYLRRHRATPAASNATLKRAFFAWWLENCANDKQKAIVAGNREISKGASYMGAFEFERFESHIYHARKLNSDGKTMDYESMTFAKFAAL